MWLWWKRFIRMVFRRTRDRFLCLLILFIFVLTASSLRHNKRGQDQIKDILTPLEEQPSVFANFISTLPQIHPPKDYKNPKISDDPHTQGSKIYRPYPSYNSQKWQENHPFPFSACLGPRNQLLNESVDDQVRVHIGIPHGFPNPIFGSHDVLGLDGKISFDRYARYGPYGFGEEEESVTGWTRPSKVDWNQVKWGELQRNCVEQNADRFADHSSTDPKSDIPRSTASPEKRTAILIRTYVGKEYSENDLHVMRSMITELSLQTGGEYEVILLLHVKDENAQIQQKEVAQKIIEENIPREFWDITVLWTTPIVAERYKNLNTSVIDVHHAQWLCIQYYAQQHPEFEFFWNWEIDTRFTGHHYEFVDKIGAFARRQPRRGLWERNARFYIPGVHGAYDTSFKKFVDQIEPQGVWGPAPIAGKPLNIQVYDPSAPENLPLEDDFKWGIGEDGDFICFLPIFHPIGTKWVIRNEVYGYAKGRDMPRRACLITHSRLSRRLLTAMDEENLAGRHMGSELFPASVALYYGLKAVSVPHPVYSERPFEANKVDDIFNPGVNGRAGSTISSIFSWGREIPFRYTSWYYRANLPGRLYWNFLGWEKGGTGGNQYELQHGRVCLPSILFHPVKDVRPDANSMGYKFDSELGFVAIEEPWPQL